MTTATQPAILLRAEGLAVFAGAIAFYADQGGSWWLFALLLLSFDVSMIGYLANPQLGSVTYNLVHSYALPIALLVGALLGGWTFGIHFALIWLAHIGMDRTVGYGLKYSHAFKATHLERV